MSAGTAAVAAAENTRRRSCLAFFILLLCLVPILLAAQDVPIPPPPDRTVTDTAGFLSPQDAERLDARLRAYEQQTKHQLLVWIGRTTGQMPIDDFANRAFERWKVGRKGVDDGLVLFIMADDHRLRFEVGYGLETEIPDLRASQIIQEIIVPRIRAGDNAGAVNAGMEAVATALGQPLPGGSTAAPVRRQARPLTIVQLIFFGIVGLVLLGFFATSSSIVTWLLISILSGGNRRRGGRGGFGGGTWTGGGWGGGGSWGGGGGGWGGGGGGWGGGGGGWSGGGGMSGGGGASGSW